MFTIKIFIEIDGVLKKVKEMGSFWLVDPYRVPHTKEKKTKAKKIINKGIALRELSPITHTRYQLQFETQEADK
jgi:hypothetical protein